MKRQNPLRHLQKPTQHVKMQPGTQCNIGEEHGMHAAGHRPRQKGRLLVAGTRNRSGPWNRTEHQGRAPIPYPIPSTLSAHIQGIPLVLCHLQGTLTLWQTFPTLSVFPVCSVLPSMLTSLLQRPGAGSPCFIQVSACVFCSQHLSQNPLSFRGGDGLRESRWTIPGSAQRPEAGNDNRVQGDSCLGGQWMLKYADLGVFPSSGYPLVTNN